MYHISRRDVINFEPSLYSLTIDYYRRVGEQKKYRVSEEMCGETKASGLSFHKMQSQDLHSERYTIPREVVGLFDLLTSLTLLYILHLK